MSLADLAGMEIRRVDRLDALCALVAELSADGTPPVLLAGGTDWMVEQEMRSPLGPGEAPPVVLDISTLDELRGIDLAPDERAGPTNVDRLRVGAATTYLEMRRSPLIRARAPLLERMARDVGAVQIQARGTLGGNLATASPAADGVAALAAYDATIVVRSVRSERRIPIAALQTGYKRSTRAADEVIVAVEIDLPPEGALWCWRKVGARRAQAISKVALAGVAEVQGGQLGRFGLGMASIAPVTALLPTVRALALARPLADLTAVDIDAAVDQDVSPIDDVRSTRVYRAHCARALARGFLRQLGAPV